MSTSELTLGATAAEPGLATPARRISSRLLRSELGLVFKRRRNIAMLSVLAAGPILLGIVIRAAAPAPGQGPPFLGQVTQNGLFLGLASVLVALPLFLPLWPANRWRARPAPGRFATCSWSRPDGPACSW